MHQFKIQFSSQFHLNAECMCVRVRVRLICIVLLGFFPCSQQYLFCLRNTKLERITRLFATIITQNTCRAAYASIKFSSQIKMEQKIVYELWKHIIRRFRRNWMTRAHFSDISTMGHPVDFPFFSFVVRHSRTPLIFGTCNQTYRFLLSQRVTRNTRTDTNAGQLII